jgi:predicted nucleotidyltransferase
MKENKTIDLNSIRPILESNDVEFAGVFGSFSRGEERKDSDIDLLVKFRKPIGLFRLVGLERALSEKLGRAVDLVTEGFISPFIKDEVMKDLKVIYEKR